MEWYERIKESLELCDDKKLIVKVYGGNWGMACNTIHHRHGLVAL